jgi:hypothetical protein
LNVHQPALWLVARPIERGLLDTDFYKFLMLLMIRPPTPRPMSPSRRSTAPAIDLAFDGSGLKRFDSTGSAAVERGANYGRCASSNFCKHVQNTRRSSG